MFNVRRLVVAAIAAVGLTAFGAGPATASFEIGATPDGVCEDWKCPE